MKKCGRYQSNPCVRRKSLYRWTEGLQKLMPGSLIALYCHKISLIIKYYGINKLNLAISNSQEKPDTDRIK